LNLFLKLAGVTALLVIIAGCDNVGNAPMGETPEQTKARMDKLSIEDHAAEIKKLSMPNKLKREAIIKLYQDKGQTAPDSVLADLQEGGAPAGAAGAPK
jgi:hypothetical protein